MASATFTGAGVVVYYVMAFYKACGCFKSARPVGVSVLCNSNSTVNTNTPKGRDW